MWRAGEENHQPHEPHEQAGEGVGRARQRRAWGHGWGTGLTQRRGDAERWGQGTGNRPGSKPGEQAGDKAEGSAWGEDQRHRTRRGMVVPGTHPANPPPLLYQPLGLFTLPALG
jgi:hypothetical protein